CLFRANTEPHIVDRGQHHALPRRCLQRRKADFNREFVAALVDGNETALVHGARDMPCAPAQACVTATYGRRHQHFDGFANQFVKRPAEQLTSGWIGAYDHTLGIADEHGIAGSGEQPFKADVGMVKVHDDCVRT
ncbi:conserved hypothetical protein, partial [Ricinus communis]